MRRRSIQLNNTILDILKSINEDRVDIRGVYFDFLDSWGTPSATKYLNGLVEVANIGSSSTDRTRTIRNSARRITQIINNGFETVDESLVDESSVNESSVKESYESYESYDSRPELDYINATSKMDYWERDQGQSLYFTLTLTKPPLNI